MSIKEFAHALAEELIKLPTRQKVIEVVNRINNVEVSGRPISEEEIEQILSLMDKELGNYSYISESFDNKATVSVMSEVRKIIAQSNSEGKKK